MSEENSIIRVIDEISSSLNAKDLEGISRHYALDDPRFSGFEDSPPYRRVNADEWRRLFAEFVSSVDSIKTEKYDTKVIVLSNCAIANGYERWETVIRGKQETGEDRFTWIFIRDRNGEWKVIHEQFTRISR